MVLREWNKRANRLNKIPVSGQFQDESPSVLLGDLSTVYTDHLFRDTVFCFKQIRKYLMAGYDRKNRLKEVRLARNDRAITVGTYVFIKELFVPLLLKLVLFGNSYNYVDNELIIFELTAKIVAHVASAVQLNELFTVQGLSATNFLVGNRSQYQYIGCSKIILMMLDGELDGYVVDADVTVWTIHCSNNTELKMPPLDRNADNDDYIITNETFTHNNVTFSVLEYHPTRLVIYKKVPKIKLMMHRLVKGKRSNRTLTENIYQIPFTLNENLSS